MVAALQPGDSVILQSGVWKDADLKFYGKGTKEKNIYLCAEVPGAVKLEGRSGLKLAGRYLQVSGLVFTNGYAPSTVAIEFKIAGMGVANDCVLSDCSIDSYNKPQGKREQWIQIYGRNNTVQYCYLAGKTTPGMTLAIRLDPSENGDNHHRLYRNYFGYRPPLRENGGETVQIGLAEVSHLNCRTIVEENYFEHCNGEIEVISVKSSENKIINNVFYECVGMVTLRHGHRNQVYGNLFYGNGVKGTGGVRVINFGQEIFNNLFYRLQGQGTASALTVLNGIPNSLPKEYMQVRDARIYNNTFYECATPWHVCFGSSDKRSLCPTNTFIVNNLVYSPSEEQLVKLYDRVDSIHFENNLLISKEGIVREFGGVKGKVALKENGYGKVPVTQAQVVKFDFMNIPVVRKDYKGDRVIGAIQTNFLFGLPDKNLYGPRWNKVK